MVKAIKNGNIKSFSDRAWFLLGHIKDRHGWQQVPDDYEQAAIPEELAGVVVEKKTIGSNVPEAVENAEDKTVDVIKEPTPKHEDELYESVENTETVESEEFVEPLVTTVVPDVPEVAESVEDKPVKRKRNVVKKQKNG